MKNRWIFKFATQVGRYLSDCPPPPSREFSEKMAQLLWTLERIEQRRRRSEISAYIRQSQDALQTNTDATLH
jgi:hypothetical protein